MRSRPLLVSATECDGLANFDGVAWRHFLPETCICAMDITTDGTVWLLGGRKTRDARSGVVETYAITPEAVAADA